MDEAERRAFVCPLLTGEFDGIDLSLLDPRNEDDRRLLITAEHPELRKSLDNDVREIHLGTNVINPRLHISMHEIVANQLWDDDPPEMWQTAVRLTEAGYERHEVLHMLASVVSEEVWNALAEHTPRDADRVRRALAALPATWEAMRKEQPAQRSRSRAERRASERRHRR